MWGSSWVLRRKSFLWRGGVRKYTQDFLGRGEKLRVWRDWQRTFLWLTRASPYLRLTSYQALLWAVVRWWLWIFLTTLWDKYDYCLLFTNEETESQGDWVTHTRSWAKQWQHQNSDPASLAPYFRRVFH